MKVERIRRKFYKRNNLEALDATKARQIKKDLRLGRRKLTNLSDHEPFKREALELFDATIDAMDAIIKGGNVEQALEYECTVFQRYVSRLEGVV